MTFGRLVGLLVDVVKLKGKDRSKVTRHLDALTRIGNRDAVAVMRFSKFNDFYEISFTEDLNEWEEFYVAVRDKVPLSQIALILPL